MSSLLSPNLIDVLVCPRDRQALREVGDCLLCSDGHRYAIVEGIPILLVAEAAQTHIEADRALAIAEGRDLNPLPDIKVQGRAVDPFVQNAIAATNGGFYIPLIGKLKEYPIPILRLPPAHGESFLEIGCNWGRWCISATRLGYRAIGIDPSLKSIRAAYRVARQLDLPMSFVVADARFLPFSCSSFDHVFSYSVLQHLSKEDCKASLCEIARVLKPQGQSLVQMPNSHGVRNLYIQLRRGFRDPGGFGVRYWSPSELLQTFSEVIGPSSISVDGYFSLDPQISDIHMLPVRYRPFVLASETLRSLSKKMPSIGALADSLYVSAARGK
jgi:SAM-dependent methyltransferase/uncharacterized protein YbaR (Trm112 family)